MICHLNHLFQEKDGPWDLIKNPKAAPRLAVVKEPRDWREYAEDEMLKPIGDLEAPQFRFAAQIVRTNGKRTSILSSQMSTHICSSLLYVKSHAFLCKQDKWIFGLSI